VRYYTSRTTRKLRLINNRLPEGSISKTGNSEKGKEA
jgi:hypothetical protein